MNPEQIVEELRKQVPQNIISLIITGSIVNSSANEESDVDFIFVVTDDTQKKKVAQIVNNVQRLARSIRIDCKIYTEKEFILAKGGRDHFFLWSSFVKSRILQGQDLRGQVQLKLHLVRDILRDSLSMLEDASLSLSDEMHLTGSCMTIFSALAASFFIELYILDSIGQSKTKREYLKSILGEGYQLVSERYQWVRDHVPDTQSTGKFKIPSKADRSFSKADYRLIHDSAEMVLGIIKRVEQAVSRILENNSFF